MKTAESNARRGPKGDKRVRTRAALLEAARAVIREKGYEKTTLQDVARRAGMTSGAIYGNFRNRDDLFIALAESYWAPIRPKFKPGATLAEILRALADATLAAIPDRAAVAPGRLTGMAYALRHEPMRERVHAITASSYELGAEWLRAVTREADLPMPADQFVRVIHALVEGLTFQRLLTPDLVPDDLFRAAFGVLAGDGTRTGTATRT